MPFESENIILLCWVQIWAMSYWYQDKSEKEFRFQQLLQIIKKIIYFESKTLYLLFDALIAAEENNMVIRLYEFLINQKVKISHVITDKLLKYLDSNSIKRKESVNLILISIGVEHQREEKLKDLPHKSRVQYPSEWTHFLLPRAVLRVSENAEFKTSNNLS